MPELSQRTLEKVILAVGEMLPDHADTFPLMADFWRTKLFLEPERAGHSGAAKTGRFGLSSDRDQVRQAAAGPNQGSCGCFWSWAGPEYSLVSH